MIRTPESAAAPELCLDSDVTAIAWPGRLPPRRAYPAFLAHGILVE